MTMDYSEKKLVEKTAINLFKKLGFKHKNCSNEFQSGESFLGRENKSEVILTNKLKTALRNINNYLPEEALGKAVKRLKEDRNKLGMFRANKEVYDLIKNGVKVKIKNKEGKYEHKTVKLINFDEPENNDFFIASQFWITGEIYQRRPDLIVFVNGIPLILIELKAANKRLRSAFDDNFTDYKDTIPQLFWYIAFNVISNGKEAKIGTLTSEYEHFCHWKKIKSEDEKGNTLIDTLINGTCEKNRFIDILENFIFYTTISSKPAKVIARYSQYLGVNNAIERFKQRKKNDGRLGVFWHTQGSGKSFSMIFYSQKILRKFKGNYTFLVVTDRLSLDDQIYQNFQNAGVVTEEKVQAEDGEHLKQLLKEDHRLIFTLIHKFHTEKGAKYPELTNRDDIIVMTDEAHRTQYDILALNMRNALPKACFLAFTATPLMAKGEEKTKETFGNYVSTYTFRDSIKDGATVPLYYENRVPELKLKNPDLNEDICNIIDKASLNEKEEYDLSRKLGKNYHIITSEQRLNIIAEDIVDHYLKRGYQGKAMVVSIDRFTAVNMFEKVKYYWDKHIKKLNEQLENAIGEEKEELKQKIEEMEDIDMAVVLSFSNTQNEIKKFRERGLNIKKHRKRMKEEDLARKFKDSDSNFRIVFLCSMWMTGFDVHYLSTIYLDKPMKNHTLMQAIARANRVFENKEAGFVIDYINVFRDLKKALAIYTPKSERDLPILDKNELVKELSRLVKEMNLFLSKRSLDYKKAINAEGMEKIRSLKKMTEPSSPLVVNEEIKKKFLQRAGKAIKVYNAILPHRKASEFTPYIELYKELRKEIRSLNPESDMSEVMKDIKKVLDKSIEVKEYTEQIRDKKEVYLSEIDFEAIREKLEKQEDKAAMCERIKNILSFKIKRMVQINNTRIDYQEKLQQLIDEYNRGSLNQEAFFKELIELSKKIKEEERRHIRENLTEEELVLFDKLKRSNLTEKEKDKIKKIAKELLYKLKNDGLSAIDWRKKAQAKAKVKLEIKNKLKKLLGIYDFIEIKNKSNILFQHFYDNYYGEGKSIYASVSSI